VTVTVQTPTCAGWELVVGEDCTIGEIIRQAGFEWHQFHWYHHNLRLNTDETIRSLTFASEATIRGDHHVRFPQHSAPAPTGPAEHPSGPQPAGTGDPPAGTDNPPLPGLDRTATGGPPGAAEPEPEPIEEHEPSPWVLAAGALSGVLGFILVRALLK
jgi:hypothetical protein